MQLKGKNNSDDNNLNRSRQVFVTCFINEESSNADIWNLIAEAKALEVKCKK